MADARHLMSCCLKWRQGGTRDARIALIDLRSQGALTLFRGGDRFGPGLQPVPFSPILNHSARPQAGPEIHTGQPDGL